ncbi:hypothetical protein W03_15930 [Nitrosomonas sp. PY1]|uniref:YezD family protein n=1 Tax=Nitrosomonas sp. PY1 TaxID=1803906 RepID=UPI001FC7D671|nr:YezD family protein [Nitrosomonas sp. PY1]GKS69589.1 hypothetical protein W03_15930 [Nitrosomonas sp. PY1]
MDTRSPLKEEDTNTDNKLPATVVQEILRIVSSIEYGSVEVVVHDNKVVQIEYREKFLLNDHGIVRCKLSHL